MNSERAPLVLFGAFDRHNLGDLLLARIAEARALAEGRGACFAGLAACDLRLVGGVAVDTLGSIAAGWRRRYGAQTLELVHVGGELLDCDAWEAAVMLASSAKASAAIAALDRDPAARASWAAERLGSSRQAPYVVSAQDLPPGSRMEFRAVGGVGLARRSDKFRDEVLAALRQADTVSVRDRITQEQLRAAGVAVTLAPDPVVQIVEWLGAEIRTHAGAGESAAVARECPDGYVAVQFAAEHGDDRSLDALARRLTSYCRSHGGSVVLFRAGAAPWHDSSEAYRRLLRRAEAGGRLFSSLHVLDIAALIAGARACFSSSLHCRIIAQAYGVPVESILTSPGQAAKLAAWIATWEGTDRSGFQPND